MFWNFLAESTESSGGSNIGSYILIIAIVGIIILSMVMNSRSAKKRQQEQQKVLDAVRPGNKVTTIGGVCGVVVEVNDEDGSFVLETGTETSGKSYVKFTKQAIYQTDAVVKDKPVETPVEETHVEETPAEETPVEEAPVEETEE